MNGPLKEWTWSDLRQWTSALTSVLVFGASLFLSQMVGCNVHELGHAAVATPLGWEVDSIRWCTPGAGAVSYSQVGIWAGNLQGYAGGLVAAFVLYGLYSVIIRGPSRPLQTPEWWAAGLGLVIWIGPQLVISAMEGSAGPTQDYTELFRAKAYIFVPVIAVAALAGIGLYVRRWRISRSVMLPRMWLPDEFEAPFSVEVGDTGFHLRQIGPDDTALDMIAVMGSQERLWSIYGEAWGWPPATMTADQDREDLKRHAEEMARNESFNYALFNGDDSMLAGCVYIDPPERVGADADISWWVIDALVGSSLELVLTDFVPEWIEAAWPFMNPRYIGVDMSWQEWLSLPEL